MTTVSVRVPDELKRQADELGLNKSEVMRSVLADEITSAVRRSRDEDAR